MESVPEPGLLQPLGLPTGVFGPGEVATSLTRDDVCEPPPDDGVLAFALHTVDVRTWEPLTVPVAEYHTTSLYEHRMRLVEDAAAEARVRREFIRNEEAAQKIYKPPEIQRTTMYITGQLRGGRKIGLVLPFRPFFQVELPSGATPAWFDAHVARIVRTQRLTAADVKVAYHEAARFNGYVPSAADPCQRHKFLFAQTSFPNVETMRRATYYLRDTLQLRVYEDGIDMDQKFLDMYSLTPSAWHTIAEAAVRPDRELLVSTEMATTARHIKEVTHATIPGLDYNSVPSLHIVSIDCEMNPNVAGRFPKAWRETDAVIVVGMVFAYAGTMPSRLAATTPEYVEYERRAYVLAPSCDEIPGVIVQLFDDEMSLIAAVRDELFVRKQVDVVTGHYILNFDIKYMAERVQRFGTDAAQRFARFGALFMETLSLRERSLASASLGSNHLAFYAGAGFVYLDTVLLCKQYQKLRENSLKYVAGEFLTEVVDGKRVPMAKFDMPYDLIPDAIRGTSADVGKLVHYCVVDCVLVLRLVQLWDAVKDAVAQSRINKILMATNLLCGQQQRVRNKLMHTGHRMGMVMNGVNERKPDNTVDAGDPPTAEGGWVMDNVRGLHDCPVVVLDFASLYPSMQRFKNLCWSTHLPTTPTPEQLETWRARGLDVQAFETATGTFYFVQNVPGVLPVVLNDLLDKRKAYKAEMAAAPYGSPAYQNGDAKQKATKIVMNSAYGTSNCAFGIMPCRAVGTVTCALGRQMNQRAAAIAQAAPFHARILYGDTDSIMLHFPEPEGLATPKARLMYAFERGEELQKAINAELNSAVVKTELEKVYFPFLSSGKKTYAGLKFEPGKTDALAEDLRRADRELGIAGGRIEAKGMKTVRRDVPVFCRRITEALLDALFYDKDLDKFWDIVHTAVEDVCHGRLPLADYGITAEIKDGYASQHVVTPQVAVSYAREYTRRGAAYVEGDRVPFVMVEEADPQRIVRPPWLDAPLAAAGPESSDDDEIGPAVVGSKTTRAMFARHPDEVLAAPDTNHIDCVYYVRVGICGVLKQVMPDEITAQELLVTYAERAREAYLRRRMRRVTTTLSEGVVDDAGDAEEVRGLPVLSHRRPPPQFVTVATFGGGGATTQVGKRIPTAAKRVKTAAEKRAAAAAKVVKTATFK